LRAVTLADKRVSKALRQGFVCSWKNISGQTDYAGSSNKHQPDYAAKEVETCAGHHNVQMMFMTGDGKVVNCLPGYWNPDAFLVEIKLAQKLDKYYRESDSIAKRNTVFLDSHLNTGINYNRAMQRESKLTGFDRHAIASRSDSDFKRQEGFLTNELKGTDQIVHERMAERPYIPFESFDVAKFIDMGLKRYSYQYGMPKEASKKDRKATPTTRMNN
jgi:thioredoxin-related protein